MKIAQVVPGHGCTTPPPSRDVDRAVCYLTRQLVSEGHDVTLFAGGDERTAAEALADPAGTSFLQDDAERTIEALATRAYAFDVIHLHGVFRNPAPLRDLAAPMVTTLHTYPNASTFRALAALPTAALIAVSNHQRSIVEKLNWKATIPYGLPRQLRRFRIDPSDYLAFVSDGASLDDIERAVETAVRCSLPLRIATSAGARERTRIGEHIAPFLAHCGTRIEFVYDLDTDGMSELLGGARALLFPIEWPDPCPLVIVDALACGTPVIAWHRGPTASLVEHEVCGFQVADTDEAVECAQRIDEISRLACRRVFDERFDAHLIACRYVDTYLGLIRAYDAALVTVASCASRGRTSQGNS